MGDAKKESSKRIIGEKRRIKDGKREDEKKSMRSIRNQFLLVSGRCVLEGRDSRTQFWPCERGSVPIRVATRAPLLKVLSTP